MEPWTLGTLPPELLVFAADLAQARRQGRLTSKPPIALASEAEAYAVQDLATSHLDWSRCGYKLGATSAEAQRIIGCSSPFLGPLFRQQVYAAGDTVPLPAGALALEAEIGFTVIADQTPGSTGWDRATVTRMIGASWPSFEVVGRRTPGEGFPDGPASIADFGLDVAVVRGAETDAWRTTDLAALPVSAGVIGRTPKSGVGANVLGHPLDALAWLANMLGEHGLGLRRDDLISTGTCLGVVAIAPGDMVSGDFGEIGTLEARFS